jgi:hypothetical protein
LSDAGTARIASSLFSTIRKIGFAAAIADASKFRKSSEGMQRSVNAWRPQGARQS